jgi:hypothetical protein
MCGSPSRTKLRNIQWKIDLRSNGGTELFSLPLPLSLLLMNLRIIITIPPHCQLKLRLGMIKKFLMSAHLKFLSSDDILLGV